MQSAGREQAEHKQQADSLQNAHRAHRQHTGKWQKHAGSVQAGCRQIAGRTPQESWAEAVWEKVHLIWPLGSSQPCPLGKWVRKLGSEPCTPLPAPHVPPHLCPSTLSTQPGMGSLCQIPLELQGPILATRPVCSLGLLLGWGKMLDRGGWRGSSSCRQGWSLLTGKHVAAAAARICLPVCHHLYLLPSHPPPHRTCSGPG